MRWTDKLHDLLRDLVDKTVLLVWEDAWSDDSVHPITELEQHAVVWRTLGVLTAVGDSRVTVCASLIESKQGTIEHVGQSMTIPIGCITAVTELQPRYTADSGGRPYADCGF